MLADIVLYALSLYYTIPVAGDIAAGYYVRFNDLRESLTLFVIATVLLVVIIHLKWFEDDDE